MRIVCTADWHGAFPENLPDGDVLVIAGDLCPVWNHDRKFQAEWLRFEFQEHLATLPHNEIIVIAGNHDFVIQDSVKIRRELQRFCRFLSDESVELDGVKFHGTPWSTKFGSWAFMAKDERLVEYWSMIPDDTDVLVVHGPPFGVCDKTQYGGESVGSHTLRDKILELKPQLVVTGHIHEAYGIDMIGPSIVANVSFRDVDYKPGNEAMVFDVS